MIELGRQVKLIPPDVELPTGVIVGSATIARLAGVRFGHASITWSNMSSLVFSSRNSAVVAFFGRFSWRGFRIANVYGAIPRSPLGLSILWLRILTRDLVVGGASIPLSRQRTPCI